MGGGQHLTYSIVNTTPQIQLHHFSTNSGNVTPVGTSQIYATASTADERVVALIDSGYTAGLGEISGVVVLHNRDKSEAVVVQYSVTPVYNGTDGTPANYTVVLLPDQQLGDAFSATYPADATVATVKISVPLALARGFRSHQRIVCSRRFHPQVAQREPSLTRSIMRQDLYASP